MNAKHLNSEKGQAIVYLVIGIVVFLGFVALAIDGGMALADRRNIQNAADAASLAGGGKAAMEITKAGITTSSWVCGNWPKNNAEVAAYDRALANGFAITYVPYSDEVGSDYNYAVATCDSDSLGPYIDVTVEISATTPSNFLQLVFPTALHNEVEAVTRVRPGGPLAYGEAIVALNPDVTPCNMETGAGFSGNALVDVYGGGIFSNGCLVGKGGSDVDVITGTISYFEPSYSEGVFNPEPVEATVPIPPSAYYIPLPDCSAAGEDHNISASKLESDLQKGDLVTLEEGLWCISGDLTINATDELHGTGVTIFMIDGKFDVDGTADIQLSAPAKSPDPYPAIPGLLIYLPPPVDNKRYVTLNGDTNSTFTGTILAPGSEITVNGTSNTDAYHSQFIGWNVKVNGGSLFEIWYDAGEEAGLPTSMELHR